MRTLSLRSHLLTALNRSSVPGKHAYSLQILRSQPKRSHTLFPLATNHDTTKVYVEETVVILCERVVQVQGDGVEKPATEGDASAPNDDNVWIPVFGIEGYWYCVPSTRTAFLYISKVDSTGLSSKSHQPTPFSDFTSAFLSYFLIHPPHDPLHLRIHIFARSQPQYLFPASAENTSKKVLDDKGLCRWWKRCLDKACIEVVQAGDEKRADALRLFCLVPGFTEQESRRLLPHSVPDKLPKWQYGHPYLTLPSPLQDSSSSNGTTDLASLSDLIPSFPDDPKSRFLHSLTDSLSSAAGEPDDWDDVYSSQLYQTSAMRRDGVKQEQEQERRKLRDSVKGGAEEFWDRMAWRQELCDGHLGCFFVVAQDHNGDGQEPESFPPHKMSMVGHPASLPRETYINLWSTFHNITYTTSNIGNVLESHNRWIKAVKAAVAREATSREDGVYEDEVWGEVSIDHPEQPFQNKRAAEEPEAKVNVLQPRKKKKPNVASA